MNEKLKTIALEFKNKKLGYRWQTARCICDVLKTRENKLLHVSPCRLCGH